MSAQTWSIGEIAARTGLSVKTVRYYSDSGLLPVAERSCGGHRRYGPEALERLRLIRRLRALDVPIAAITGVVTGERGLEDLLTSELDTVQERLAGLRWRQATLQALDDCEADERLRRLEVLSQVGDLPQAHTELYERWDKALPASLPPQVADTLVAAATPHPPAEPSPRHVLAYAELHLITAHPHFHEQLIFPVDTRAGLFYTGLLDSVAVASEALIQRSAEQLVHAGQLLADACARAYRTQNTPDYHHELRLYFQARPLVPRYWNHVKALAPDPAHGGASAYTRLIQQFTRPQAIHT
ncbi:MerR family transcriptional regulator [Streptomyces fumanus]|uniref:helix-turn-helix domain-containing protein n=1 Tax=Streptomyces fumanus TaxID=67302 RepID=UPI00340BDA94